MTAGRAAEAARGAERAAELARSELGIGLDGPVPDLVRLLEDEAGLRVFILPLGDEGIDGAYQRDQGEPFVLVNQSFDPTRQRFTLAHEYGHHYLGHGAQLDDQISLSEQVSGKEAAANRFASSLLMPRRAIDDWFARNGDPEVSLAVLVRIAFAFNVSTYVARYRLAAVRRLRGRAEIRRLDAGLEAKEHYDLARQLALVRASDTIQVSKAKGAYVPARMQAKVAELVERGLLSTAAARARLRLPEDALLPAQVEELFDPMPPPE